MSANDDWDDWESDEEPSQTTTTPTPAPPSNPTSTPRLTASQLNPLFLRTVTTLLKTYQISLSSPQTLPTLTSHLLTYSSSHSLVLNLLSYYSNKPDLYNYTIKADVSRCVYTLIIQKSTTKPTQTFKGSQSVADALKKCEPKKTAKAHLVVRASNQSLLATLLQALNDESTPIYNLIRPPELSDYTTFVTKSVSFYISLLNDAKMPGFSYVLASIKMDVLVHTLSIGELEFEMKFTPGESEDNMLWIVAKDARCKVLGDEDIRRGVEEMVRDGVLRDGGVAEEEVLNNGVKAHLAASVLKGEVKIAGKGVASDIKMAAGGVVVGSLFRGIKKGVEVIVKSAVEEGVRGDEDLLGDTPVKKREEEESEFGRLFDGVGEKMAQQQQGQQQQEQQQQQQQQQIMEEPTQNENNFGKLFDSVGETVTSSPPPPMQHAPAAQPDPAANKFAAMFEERGMGKQSLEPQHTNQPTGVGMLGGFFGALGLENLSHAVAPPPPPHAQQNQPSLPSSSESPNQIGNDTTQPPPTPIEPKFVPPIVPVSNVPPKPQPPPPNITSNQEPTLSPNSPHDYTESELKRISLGYDSDGDLGGDYGKDNPPTGKRFGGYGKGFTSICWEDE